MDVEAFEREGFVVVPEAVERSVVEECREAIWDTLARRGIRRECPASWPVLAEIDSLDNRPFVTAGYSPALASACDTLIGAGRWSSPIRPGAALVVRFEGESRSRVAMPVRQEAVGGRDALLELVLRFEYEGSSWVAWA